MNRETAEKALQGKYPSRYIEGYLRATEEEGADYWSRIPDETALYHDIDLFIRALQRENNVDPQR